MNEITIAIIVAITVAVIFGIKLWVHWILRFKMDESAILNYLKTSMGEFEHCSIAVISEKTDISTNRVAIVCSKSKLIQKSPEEKESWRLKV